MAGGGCDIGIVIHWYSRLEQGSVGGGMWVVRWADRFHFIKVGRGGSCSLEGWGV